MRWNYPAIRKATRAGRDPLSFGPWRSGDWYTPSWHVWRKGGMRLEITESRVETQTLERGPEYGTGPRSHEERIKTDTASFIADITPADLWRGSPLDAPSGSSFWSHASRCAFGEGLYHCEGHISLNGSLFTTNEFTHSFTPADGEPSTSTTYFERTDPHHVAIDYSTLATALAGLATPCRITVAQLLPPIYVAWWDSDLWFPLPEDPDGNTEDEDGNPVAEVYWTDTALAALAAGTWGDTMDLTGGSLSAPTGPNLGGVDNGDFNAHTYTRSGSLLLTIG